MPPKKRQEAPSSDQKPVAKKGRVASVPNFTPEEDIALCRAFVNVSGDPVIGTDQRLPVFYRPSKQ
jgi:hypothetical protein